MFHRQEVRRVLEKMGAFFDARLDEYDAHQLNCIDSAKEFYPFTAACLPKGPARILDLGCGTGLELEYYFQIAPAAVVTGIDLAPGMLDALKKKFPDKALTVIRGSYFDVPFGENAFDAAVSVESLHHYTKEEKIPLYTKLHYALKPGGYFILTDYFSLSDEEERQHRDALLRLKAAQGIAEDALCHYDTPLTAAHEVEALQAAGFASVEVLHCWGATHTLKAVKSAERPALDRQLDSKTFRDYYYLKEELTAFCRENALPVSGGKQELTERIAAFLETGQIPLKIKTGPAKRKRPDTEITPDSIIEPGFVCSEKHRAFFKAHIGKGFSFCVDFQKWLKANSGKTYREAIAAYHTITDEKKSCRTAIDRQFEYNTYIRDFFADNAGKTLEDAIRCWKYKKSLPGHNRYEESDLSALEK